MPGPAPLPDDNGRALSSRPPSSPSCGEPTRGRCWRPSASTTRRSKRPSPPRRARPFRGRRHGRRPRPSAAPLPCPAQTRSCSTRTWSSPSIRRAASTTRPALHPKLIEALGPKQGEGIVHVGAGAGYYSAILAELVDPAGQVTAVEFDAALAKRAKALSGRPNVRVICDDGARGRKPRPTGFTSVLPWRGRPIAGSKACLRAAGSSSRSVCLAPSGRIAAAGTATAARRSGSNGAATPTRRVLSAWPILSAPRENSRLIPKR
jgi:hypothetical protein